MSDKIVLVTDYTWPSTAPEAEVLARVGARLLEAETGSEEELLRLVPEADAILTCFKQVPVSVVRAGTKLQVIGRYGIGVDNIPVDEATRLGIPVTNVPAYCLDEVAEHALALLLAGARNIVRYDRAVQKDNWSLATGMPVYRVAGRTLAIIGFGKIGRTLARKAAALDLQLLAHDPWVPDAEIRAAGVEPAGLDEALARADFVSLHTPLTEETQHLLNAERLARIKPGAFVINTARGALIDQEALLAALQSGRVSGAGLDVFVPEHLPPDHALLAQPGVIATPHTAFYSEESVLELERLAAQNVADILSGRRPADVVNPEVLALERWSHLE
ncbi:MAG: C-terminal binding protein [Anaerolineaceae bacterium]|nr:C-terminal binding protein [Anaerolineaceae bacterium]